ncbi:hypothetical protein [Anaeromyxobacter sp. PSR-1]|uniref:hypothetical protein n=1 Tax=Anaeromyxobacter sp. PSR-1 TaxID=1300915 RepID=UPI0005DC37A4|nr:hypothetical protein [Anaeromyxobacter sp. PSR-1]GAO01224.1 hypothetical protein PSR1_00076 [Anaeromyxobacter sp. PSR-1]
MATARALATEQPIIRVVRFYKMDHLGDPLLQRNGRIRLGVEDCKAMLRSGIKPPDFARNDNLIIAIGGVTAKDGLRDRLAWGGIAVERQHDGSIDCEDGFLLVNEGPLEWRAEFPLIAKFIDPVQQGHRVGRIEVYRGDPVQSITPALCREFIRMFEWGMQVAAAHRGPRPTGARSGLCAPRGGRPPAPRPLGICPPPRKKGGC